MNSIILRAAIRGLVPLLLLFSVYLLLVGHNEPGGGFVGGLVAAAAFSLHTLAHDARRARWLAGVEPRSLVGAGLACALVAGLIGMAAGRPFLTGLWIEAAWDDQPLAIGTPLLFDLGVYLLVAGTVLLMVFTLAEE